MICGNGDADVHPPGDPGKPECKRGGGVCEHGHFLGGGGGGDVILICTQRQPGAVTTIVSDGMG